MFVLPPPPRYPQAGQYVGLGGPGSIPMIETNNTLTFPEGPEYQFLVGEGTYVLKEDLHLATPPPHPSEAPIINPNPLATNPQPASAGTKVSVVSIEARPAPYFYKGPTSATFSLNNAHSSIQEHPNERYSTEAGLSSDGGGGSISDAPPTSLTLGSAPAFGDGNTALQPVNTKDVGKKKKPKNNMTKSNSSFISRVIVNEHLTKKLTDRALDGVFFFANINRAFQWLDMAGTKKARPEYLTKILFTKAHCLCHDVNHITKSAGHIDIIMGFSTGEVIWWEPISQRYTRLNKNGIINGTPVSQIKWIPGSENLFLASHMDGSLVVYDKEKEDAPFSPEEDEAPLNDSSVSGSEKETNGHTNGNGNGNGVDHRTKLQIYKSVYSKNQKVNPVASWKLSNQRINAFAFSPDNRHLAAVSEDGTLRIIDYLKEELLDLFHSYYGGLISVCWSPDGKYVLTGGQDDLISIWSVLDSAIVARCHGHQSWVTSVAFDPWRCDDRNYRFGSVGEDCRLCLWDFNVGMLHRPKAASVRQRGSVSSRFPGSSPLQRMETANTTASGRLRSNSALSTGDMEDDEGIEHAVESRARTAMLPPVMSKVVHPGPMCWLEFTEDSIMTSCKSGHIRTWSRPSDAPVPTKGATQ